MALVTEPVSYIKRVSNTKLPALVIDFDGVLSIKRTYPIQHYPQVPELIKALSQKYRLYVASFNPNAEKTLIRWGLRKYFQDVRSGSNFAWKGSYTGAVNLAKSSQIQNMLTEEDDITLYDDSLHKLEEVKAKLPNVKIVLVDPRIGLVIAM